jgi:hypothetical protein
MTADWSRPLWRQTGRPANVFYFIPGDPPASGLHQSLKAAAETITVPHLVIDTGRASLGECVRRSLAYLGRD